MKTIPVALLITLSLTYHCDLELLQPDRSDDSPDFQYALSAHLSPERPVQVTLSKVVSGEYYVPDFPFSGAVDSAMVKYNDSLIYPVDHYENLQHRSLGYNYLNRNLYPAPNDFVKIQAVVNSDTLIGTTTIPGAFSFQGYTGGTLEWSSSTNAFIYCIEAYYKNPDEQQFQWKKFVKIYTSDTSQSIRAHLNWEQRRQQMDDHPLASFDSIRFEVTTFDEHYYLGVLNDAPQAGITNGYGVVGSSVTIDTILQNILETGTERK